MIKNRIDVHIDKNGFVDEGDGLIRFPAGQVISDGTNQRNGTRYDIESMDLSEYKGQVTADHIDSVQTLIGKALNIGKRGSQLVIDGIKFAVKENSLARLAYDLMRGGYLTDLSIETYGPPPDDEDVYYNAKLIGLSTVVVGNNRSASVNELVLNSIARSKQDGLDTSELEKAINGEEEPPVKPPEAKKPKEEKQSNKKEPDMKFVTIKNSRGFAVKVAYKNAAGDDTETELPDGGSVDVSDDQRDDVQAQVDGAEAPKAPEEPQKPEEGEDEDDSKPSVDANAIESAVKAAIAPMQETITKLEQNAFDKGAKEPEFKKNKDTNTFGGSPSANAKANLKSMGWEERTVNQIEGIRRWLRSNDFDALTKARDINAYHLDQLKEKGVVKNAVTISDFGNFVTSPELLTQIEGCRNNYQPIIGATTWRETMSLDMSWLERNGEIEMEDVEFCDDGADGNLKPIKEYGATPRTDSLKESAAVTPICNAATRFVAVDLLGDVAEEYRNAYDRKRAQMIIARLEQAVEFNGNSVIYDTNPAVEGLVSLINAYKEIVNCTPNGTWVMNASTEAELMAQILRANLNNDVLGLFFSNGSFFKRPYVVVPDDLMPTLNTAGTKVFTIDGVTVTVNHAIFYADLSKFTGRISGGLQYDLSTEAAYEEGGSVKSAFQRDELLIRGYFYRGAAMRDRNQVAGVLSPGVS